MSASVFSNPSTGFARQRDLWWQFTVRTVEQRHRGSHLGLVWAVLNPLLMLALYFIVFSRILGGRLGALPDETPVDFALALFLGLILFQLLAETAVAAPAIIVNNPNLVKKVVFPLEILPLAHLGAFWFHTLISLGLLLLGAATFGRGLTLEGLAWLAVIIAPLVLLSIGIGWLFSAVGVFFRDLGQAMPFLSQILLYISLVFFPIAKVPPALMMVLKWNPLLHTIDLARSAVLWNLPINLKQLAYTYIFGGIIFFIGRWTFLKLKPSFADVI